MEITHAGESTFSIGPAPAVAINPAEPVRDAVTLRTSRRAAAREVVSGPGEFEVRGALIAAIPAGDARAQRLMYAINVDGINVLVVDGPASAVARDAIESAGPVDVLVLDTSEGDAAKQLVRNLTPRVTIPFGSNAPAIAAMLGVKDAEPVTRFVWNGISAAPRAVLLREGKGRKRAA